MAATTDTIGFIGDLLDPWVAAIADALPTNLVIKRVNCAGDIPEEPFGLGQSPALVVLHRHGLSALDRARMKRWTETSESKLKPTVVLCVSPYVRYDDIERMCLASSIT